MNIIHVLDEHYLTTHQRRYWCGPKFQRRAATQGVALIDPWRTHLRILRKNPEYIGKKVYRASTGGAWGKSAVIVTL